MPLLQDLLKNYLTFIKMLASIPTPGKFEMYRDSSGLYRFRLKAENGEIIVREKRMQQRQPT